MCKIISIFALSLLLSTAQGLLSQIVLQGTVQDNGGKFLGNGSEAVQNALVTLTDQGDPGRTFSANTDEQGHYTMQILLTALDDDPENKPEDFQLLQNYPNPFNPATVITYRLPFPSPIRLEIYNVLGQKIRTLLDGYVSHGSGRIIWDATDDRHQGVPAGLYFCTLQAGEVRICNKMVLIDGQQYRAHPLQGGQMEAAPFAHDPMNKSMSNFYTLKVTGDNIAAFEQKDLQITGDMILDLVVNRTAIDIDGNVYETVKIGDQWWMTENLKVVHYRNGDPVTHVADASQWLNPGTGFYCNYDNNEEIGSIYGRLYNLFVLKDSRMIAPEGWHVPSDEDWQTLIGFLGDSAIAGGKMKEADTTHWASPNTGATNECGFTALASGYRGCGGSFRELRYTAYYWSSTFSNFELTSFRILRWDSMAVITQSYGTLDGYSIRCVRD